MYLTCRWGKVCYDLEDMEEKLFSTLSLGSWLVAKKSSQWLRCLVSQAWSIPIPLNIMVRLIESWTRAQSMLLITVSIGDTIKQSKVGMMGGFAHNRLQLILGDLSATSVRWLCTTLMSCAIAGFLNSGAFVCLFLFVRWCEQRTSRLEICHHRRDLRLCKLFSSGENLSRKQCVFLHN